MQHSFHEKYMKMALNEAKNSGKDIPVGAVIVKDDKVIAKACNNKEIKNDPTGHAEMLVLRETASKLQNWRLENTVIYVTLEPCPMCAAAILYSRIPKVVFGAYDALYGSMGSVFNMDQYIKFSPQVIGGILENECRSIIKTFFQKKRERIK